MSFIGNMIADRFLKPAHDLKVSQFAEFTPAAGGVAFLGDSITAAGQWHYVILALSRGATYLDLWPVLTAADGTLRAEFTLATLHLTGAGYRAWAGALHDVVVA